MATRVLPRATEVALAADRVCFKTYFFTAVLFTNINATVDKPLDCCLHAAAKRYWCSWFILDQSVNSCPMHAPGAVFFLIVKIDQICLVAGCHKRRLN